MDDRKRLALASVLGGQPQSGGLRFGDYPNPYGLRAYQKEDGSYGGEMMPKGSGWMGPIGGSNGGVMTEYSTGDDKGDFPSIVPTLNQDELLAITTRNEITPAAYAKALKWANDRRNSGKSPFLDLFEGQ